MISDRDLLYRAVEANAERIRKLCLEPIVFDSFPTYAEVFRCIDSGARARALEKLQMSLEASPIEPPYCFEPMKKQPLTEPADEPLPEHVRPVVTSFDQALYLLSTGWKPGS